MPKFSAAELFGTLSLQKLGSDGSSGSSSTPPLNLTKAKYTFPFAVDFPENRIEARFIHFSVRSQVTASGRPASSNTSRQRVRAGCELIGLAPVNTASCSLNMRPVIIFISCGVIRELNMTVGLFQNPPVTRESNGPGNVTGKSRE